MISQEDVTHFWIVMSAMAGTITALAQSHYKEMTWKEIALALFSGFGFAVFFMPAVAIRMGVTPDDIRSTNAIVYLGGTGWNIFIPLAISWVRRRSPGKDES